MSVLHLAAIRKREMCVFVCEMEVILCSTARLLSRRGTGVPSFWLPPCVPAVPKLWI